MGESLGTLLRAASDPVGDARPPTVAELVARRRRRTGLRTAGAMLATAAAVASVAAVVANRPDRTSGRHHVPPAINRPRPPAIGVTVDQLAGYRWRALPTAPIPPRDGAAAVWTGHEVIVWGGVRGNEARSDGAAYDPVTHSWTALPPSPVAGADVQAVWTGRSMVVWAGTGGASYDPAAREWTRLSSVSEADTTALVAWRGRAVVLHGTRNSTLVRADAYDPQTNHWQHLPSIRLTAHHDLGQLEAAAAGVTLYVWAEWAHTRKTGPDSSETTPGIDAYRFTGAWSESSVRPGRGASAAGAVALGGYLFFPEAQLWCGFCPGPLRATFPGALVDLDTGAARSTPATHDGHFASTGRAVLVLNTATTGGGMKPGDLAAWEPGRTRWVHLPSAPLGAGEQATVLWAGSRLIAWGSQGGLEFAG